VCPICGSVERGFVFVFAVQSFCPLRLRLLMLHSCLWS